MSKTVKWDNSVKDSIIKRLCECSGCDFCNNNDNKEIDPNCIDPKCNIWTTQIDLPANSRWKRSDWSSLNINKKWICVECLNNNLIYS